MHAHHATHCQTTRSPTDRAPESAAPDPDPAHPDPASPSLHDRPTRPTRPDLTAVRAGDENAWRHLVSHFDNLVRGVARRTGLHTGADVDDAVQATWVKLFLHLPRLREDAALPGWLATTARREALTLARRGSREVATEDITATADYDLADEVLTGLVAEQQRRDLRSAAARLPDRERRLVECLLQPDVAGYADVSRRLHMPVGAIGPVRGRAIKRMRRHLVRT